MCTCNCLWLFLQKCMCKDTSKTTWCNYFSLISIATKYAHEMYQIMYLSIIRCHFCKCKCIFLILNWHFCIVMSDVYWLCAVNRVANHDWMMWTSVDICWLVSGQVSKQILVNQVPERYPTDSIEALSPYPISSGLHLA